MDDGGDEEDSLDSGSTFIDRSINTGDVEISLFDSSKRGAGVLLAFVVGVAVAKGSVPVELQSNLNMVASTSSNLRLIGILSLALAAGSMYYIKSRYEIQKKE
ncbi:hypothetical protein [Halobellus sp. Atlit-38R]|uniref:hypothetical protein n=1 Tax=Halobellus sp. Atlit-38R TaxID=2282131 RepID=UPI0011C473F2|nr:hypothetical protein [Halobellus sp. Atlit-38R]